MEPSSIVKIRPWGYASRMRAVLFLLIASPVCSAEPPDLNRWARQDVGGFLGNLPGVISALGSERPVGPLDLPLAPPLPLPMGGTSPLTSWMERTAADTTRHLAGAVAELGRADVVTEPVKIAGSVPDLGYRIATEPPAERPLPLGGISPLRPTAEAGQPALWRPKTDLGPSKYTMRGTSFKTSMIKPSPVRSGNFRPMAIHHLGDR